MKHDPQAQRAFASEIVERLRAAGYEALWAGGCVRDQLLGRIPKDYDVATSAEPDAIRQLFGHRRSLPIGAAFGVITVLGPKQAGQIEVATFRQDFEYTDGRRPGRINFSSAREDAQRRDFTINGLFYDPLANEVIDYVGGRQDLEDHLIRAIGDPVERFTEDKLRVLRAVRFSATFAFTIEPATWDAVCAMHDAVGVVSAERIAAEMRRLLVEQHRAQGLQLLHASRLWEAIVPPPLQHPAENAWAEAVEVCDYLETPTFPTAAAALVAPLADKCAALQLCRQWKLSNAETDRIAWLIDHAYVLDNAAHLPWPALQPILIHEAFEELLTWGDARVAARLADRVHLEYCREQLARPAEQLDPAPLVDGADLKACGIRPGPMLGQLLATIRTRQLAGELTSRDEALRFIRETAGHAE